MVAPGAGAVVGSSAVGRRKAAAEKKKRRVTLSFLPAGKRLFLDPPANFTGSATKANPHTTGRPCRLPAGRYRYRAHLVTSIITTVRVVRAVMMCLSEKLLSRHDALDADESARAIQDERHRIYRILCSGPPPDERHRRYRCK